MDSKRILIVTRHAPYGSSLAREAIDATLATGVFEAELSLLFLDDGVWQLLAEQQPQQIGQKNLGNMLGALAIYDVERVYADADALSARGLAAEALAIAVEPLSAERVAQMIAEHDVVLSF